MGDKISLKEKDYIILICGDKGSYSSLRSLNAQLRKLSFKNIKTEFLKKDNFQGDGEFPLDEELSNYANSVEKYRGVILIMLAGKIGEGLLGAGELFDKGALCLIEAESDYISSPAAQSFLSTGKAHMEVGINDMGKLIELYFENPEEMKTFFNPRTQIVWEALSSQFQKHELDIRNFKQSFIFECLLKRLAVTKKDVKSYIRSMEQDPLEVNNFYDFLDIHSTKFLFDDYALYKELQEDFLPQLIKKAKDKIKIWNIGCSTGHVPVSLALIIHDYLISEGIKQEFSIFATDSNYNYLVSQGHLHGFFHLNELKNIPEKYHKYLVITQFNFSLVNDVRSNIIFSKQNIIQDQGFFNFNLVFCKNILFHLKESSQHNIWKKLNHAVKQGGYLIIDHESANTDEINQCFTEKGKLRKTFYECAGKETKNIISDFNTERINELDERLEKLSQNLSLNLSKEVSTEDQIVIDPNKDLLNSKKHLKKESFFRKILNKLIGPKENIPPQITTTIGQEKEIRYLEKIEALEKELELTKTSLSAASTMFEKTLEEQIQSSDDLKKVNKELTNLKDNLIKMVEERTEDLRKANQDLSTRQNQLEQTNKDLQVKSSLLKHTNLDLAKREGQLKEKTRDIQKSNKTLENLQKERALFFAKISHELRTPLNAILGFSDILLNKTGPTGGPQHKQFLESIYSSGKSLLNLVNSVHDFTKIDLQELSVIKQKINISKFLKELTTYYTNECANKGVMFFLDLSENFPHWIESDELRLRQVFDNILGNALKFTHDGHIGIVAKANFEEDKKDIFNIVFKIEDTGRGIEADKLDKLFKTFSQVHEPGTVQERGTGLGLYISQQIIEKLGGSINVTSSVGHGTIFTLALNNVPILQGEEEDKEKISYKFFGDRILIADDEPINISLYNAYLASHNLTIETALDGQELVEKAKNFRPSLIITDYKMPIMTGNEALKSIKKESQNVPMILVSALKVKENIKKEFQSFLQKPVEQQTFLKEISKYIKHEIVKNEVITLEVENIEFSIPENLSKNEKIILLEIKHNLEQAIQDTEINFVEKMAYELSQKIENTNLAPLIPWFNQLQIQASHFNIQGIEKLLREGLNKINSFKKAS